MKRREAALPHGAAVTSRKLKRELDAANDLIKTMPSKGLKRELQRF